MAFGEREQGRAPAGRGGLDRFRYEYGAEPLHLIALASSLLLCGYALLRISEIPSGARVFIWLLAAALLHDLVALPVYSVLIKIAHGAAGRAITTRGAMLHALNHVRVPAGLSLLLLLVYSPLILRIAPEEYAATTGRSLDVYLERWLLISAALFLVSGVIYAIRLRRGIPEPTPLVTASAAENEPDAPPAALPWRIGARVTLAGVALAVLWVTAAVAVGLITNGL
jgi:hypothetical protein